MSQTVVQVRLRDEVVGHLARSLSRSGDVVGFQYAASWLRGSGTFGLDPQLPLVEGFQYARAGADKLSPAFVDCSPDRWGCRLMDRREAMLASEENRPIRNLRAWDYLVGVDDETRMGALRLWDLTSGVYIANRLPSAPPVTDLRELEIVAEAVERGDAVDTPLMRRWLKMLVAPGASLGGARPKAVFRDNDGSLWLAKFPSLDDSRDMGLWELLAHKLSLACGITAPPARVLHLSNRGSTFAVKRFDRAADDGRLAYASAMTLLDADHSEGYSYLDIVQTIERVGSSTSIVKDLEQLFRRALFNVMIGNRDDHLRNHGFLRDGDGWRLSPAFDVSPNPDKHDHVLALDENSSTSPDSERVMATARFYRLSDRRTKEIATDVLRAVRGWEKIARAIGMRSSDMDLLRGVIYLPPDGGGGTPVKSRRPHGLSP